MTFGARDYRYSRSRGVFGRVEPSGDDGAYEIALRYSSLDLDDAEVDGGEQTEHTIALSWIHSRQLRLMASYARIETRPNRDGDDETVDAVGLRLLARL